MILGNMDPNDESLYPPTEHGLYMETSLGQERLQSSVILNTDKLTNVFYSDL